MIAGDRRLAGVGRVATGILAAVTLVVACVREQDVADRPLAPVTTQGVTTTTAAPATSTTVAEPADDGFAVPESRRTELERAGLGWMLGVEYPTQPAGVPWPTKDWAPGPLPAGVDAAGVQAIVDEAFRVDETGQDAGKVDALLAVSGGRLVLEAYNGWAEHDPFARAVVPEWSGGGDGRRRITVDDLLHMRSGLAWQEEYDEVSDVITLLYGEGRADRAHYAASKPLAVAPGTTFSYSTGTSMILSRLIADHVGSGAAGTAWLQRHLFDPLGITSVSHDLDGAGTISGGSHIDMSARDFARFGLLYLRGGEWDGRRILPPGWVDYARLPRPDAKDYGAHWWVDADGPLVSFRADGFAGQSITIVPTLDLVVVARANTQDGSSDVAADALVDAFAASVR